MQANTGHPFIDIGVATITAFAGKRKPEDLGEEDLEAIAQYMAENYTVNPLKSFLTVVFPNSGFTNPAFEKRPERRREYAERVLHGYRAETPLLEEGCVYTGQPAYIRAFRQHIPLITGEEVINFHPYGDAGLPVSGEALLAIQAFPLGCAKVQGRLLAVHADDPALTFYFARRFLEQNRQNILTAQQEGSKKLPEPSRRVATLFIETLLEIEGERREAGEERVPASITAYHLSNSGQGVGLDIYHLPLEITDFLQVVMTPDYKEAWEALQRRGWEITRVKRGKKGQPEETPEPRYNVLYEDLFQLPDEAARFIRTYFLRLPRRRVRKGDPRATYSLRSEANLVSWELTELFLRKVVHMDKNRIEEIRKLGDMLADYVDQENDRRFFRTFFTAPRYEHLRAALIRASHRRIKQGQPPVITFDQFITVFEEGEDLPYTDWRLARDLVLIRMMERLYQQGRLQAYVEEVPEPEETEEG